MTVPIRYRLTVEDYAALVNAMGLRRWLGPVPSWLWYALGVGNLAIIVAMVVLGVGTASLWMMSVGLAVFAFGAPALSRVLIRREYNRQRLGDNDVVLSFMETGLVSQHGEIRTEIGYKAITKVDERRDHILLWLNGRQALIVPKRALGDMSATFFNDRVERHRER